MLVALPLSAATVTSTVPSSKATTGPASALTLAEIIAPLKSRSRTATHSRSQPCAPATGSLGRLVGDGLPVGGTEGRSRNGKRLQMTRPGRPSAFQRSPRGVFLSHGAPFCLIITQRRRIPGYPLPRSGLPRASSRLSNHAAGLPGAFSRPSNHFWPLPEAYSTDSNHSGALAATYFRGFNPAWYPPEVSPRLTAQQDRIGSASP